MKTVLKILRIPLLTVPFILPFFAWPSSEFEKFYLVATLVLLWILVGVALYEDQWEGDPGAFCRGMRTFVFVATIVLTIIIFLIKSAMQPLCFGCMAVLYLSFVIYLFYLHIGSFEAGTFFSIVSFFPVIFLTGLANVDEPDLVLGSSAILSFTLWIISIPISAIISKISGRFVKPKQYELSVSDMEEMVKRFNKQSSKNQATILRVNGNKIVVSVRGATGDRDSWGKHAFCAYCQSTFGVDLHHSNVRVDS